MTPEKLILLQDRNIETIYKCDTAAQASKRKYIAIIR